MASSKDDRLEQLRELVSRHKRQREADHARLEDVIHQYRQHTVALFKRITKDAADVGLKPIQTTKTLKRGDREEQFKGLKIPFSSTSLEFIPSDVADPTVQDYGQVLIQIQKKGQPSPGEQFTIYLLEIDGELKWCTIKKPSHETARKQLQALGGEGIPELHKQLRDSEFDHLDLLLRIARENL